MPAIEPLISLPQFVVGWFIVLLAVAWIVEIVVDKQIENEKAHQAELKRLNEQTKTHTSKYIRKIS